MMGPIDEEFRELMPRVLEHVASRGHVLFGAAQGSVDVEGVPYKLLLIFPFKAEVFGGEADGVQVSPYFEYNIMGIRELFSGETHAEVWESGIAVSIYGILMGKHVCIRALCMSPDTSDGEAPAVYNTITGRFEIKPPKGPDSED